MALTGRECVAAKAIAGSTPARAAASATSGSSGSIRSVHRVAVRNGVNSGLECLDPGRLTRVLKRRLLGAIALGFRV
jgi:hypothetical protein